MQTTKVQSSKNSQEGIRSHSSQFNEWARSCDQRISSDLSPCPSQFFNTYHIHLAWEAIMKSKFALVLACLSILSFSNITAANAIGSEYEMSGSLEDAYKMFEYDNCPTSGATYTPTEADFRKKETKTESAAAQATKETSSCCHNGGTCKGAACKCPPGHCGKGHCKGGSCESHKHKSKADKPVILWDEKPPKHSKCPVIKAFKKLKLGVKHLFKK